MVAGKLIFRVQDIRLCPITAPAWMPVDMKGRAWQTTLDLQEVDDAPHNKGRLISKAAY